MVTEASVTTMELNLNAAYQVLETVSIGGGIRYIMAEGSFGAVFSKFNIPQLGVEKGGGSEIHEGDDTAWGVASGTAWRINENNALVLPINQKRI